MGKKVCTLNVPGHYLFECPACDGRWHSFDTRWKFNNNFEKPTFTPSLSVKYPYGDGDEKVHCHLFIRDGRIQYCNDCTHDMAGKTIDMIDIDDEGEEDGK